MKVTIDRAKWAFGANGGELFDGNKFCALGFCGLAAGYSPYEMLCHDILWTDDSHDIPGALLSGQTHVHEANDMTIKNGAFIDLAEREEMVALALLDCGVEVTFVGQYP